jgi:SAM-dependent methyltransferase
MAVPVAIEHDAATPAFWDERYRSGQTPWDAGRTPLELERHLAQIRGLGRVLVPGCGAGYEVRAFASHGYEVTAIDFSVAAIERARAEIEPLQATIVLADFFAHDFGTEPFDIAYDRAFLASLPRELWLDYAARMAQLIRPAGRLIGYFVYGNPAGGPPFCLRPGELGDLLGDNFESVEETAVEDSVPIFAGKELWEVWIRKPAPTASLWNYSV